MPMLLVAYDIPDDRRRRTVMKALMRLGRRVQYSVFLVRRASVEAVAAALRPLLLASEDDVRVHVICCGCEAQAVLVWPCGTASRRRSS